MFRRNRLLYPSERLHAVEMLDVRLRFRCASRFSSDSILSLIDSGRFTGQYIHTSAHRSLDFLLQAHEENMFKTLKNGP
jgi:hypothetical protein